MGMDRPDNRAVGVLILDSGATSAIRIVAAAVQGCRSIAMNGWLGSRLAKKEIADRPVLDGHLQKRSFVQALAVASEGATKLTGQSMATVQIALTHDNGRNPDPIDRLLTAGGQPMST